MYIRPSWKKYNAAYEKHKDYKVAAKECGVQPSAIRDAVRHLRQYNKAEQGIAPKSQKTKLIAELEGQFSDKELRALIASKKKASESHDIVHDFDGEELTIGVMSDTHIGSKYTNYEYFDDMYKQFSDARVDMVVHAGDVTEGMSNRAGHWNECTEIGYYNQRKKAIELLSAWGETEMYMVSGNHDDWYVKSNGAHIVKDICGKIDNATFLGNNEGNIHIGATEVRLWHGLDGSSYAHSYRIQKIIESLTGGDKPNVLIAGHTHKAFYTYDRHVHCISAGCIQKQSSWMRGKRLPAHTGFWIIRMVLNDKGVARFNSEWFPFYA